MLLEVKEKNVASSVDGSQVLKEWAETRGQRKRNLEEDFKD